MTAPTTILSQRVPESGNVRYLTFDGVREGRERRDCTVERSNLSLSLSISLSLSYVIVLTSEHIGLVSVGELQGYKRKSLHSMSFPPMMGADTYGPPSLVTTGKTSDVQCITLFKNVPFRDISPTDKNKKTFRIVLTNQSS